MRKAVEYLEGLFEEPYNLDDNSIESDFLNIIKQAQLEAIERTAVEGAKISLINDDDWHRIVEMLKKDIE